MYSKMETKMKTCMKLFAMVIVGGTLLAGPALAESELTLTRADGVAVRLSLKQLMEMPATEFSTSTPWTTGVQKFKGVDFAYLLRAYNIDSDAVWVSALNDYSVLVPTEVLRTDGAILAYHLNDAEMSVRDKGPFWVVFPYDSGARYQTDTHWSYSVWQVKSVDGQK